MNKKIFMSLIVLIAAAAIAAGCGGKAYKQQAIHEETDRCETCNMAVKDDSYATQIITTEGQALKFDDLGCMNEWMRENGTDTIGAAFVRDYHSKTWVNYEKAYYVYETSFKTPMAYGIVSFEKESDAQAFIHEQGKGKLMTAKDLDSHSWERNRDMMKMGGMDEHTHDAEGGNEGSAGHEKMNSGMNGSGGQGE